MKRVFFIILLLIVSFIPAWAQQDEVSKGLKKTEQLYRQRKYREAVEELQFIIVQIKSKELEGLKGSLPPPLAGWKAQEPTGTMAGPALLGGGIKVSRVYMGPSGEQVEVSIFTDSPLVQSLLSLFSSITVLGGSENARFFLYKGQKAVEKFSELEREGEIDLILANKTLVSIRGSNIQKKEALYKYLEGLDLHKLKASAP